MLYNSGRGGVLGQGKQYCVRATSWVVGLTLGRPGRESRSPCGRRTPTSHTGARYTCHHTYALTDKQVPPNTMVGL